MKVLHVSASDIGGGAARAAYRLHAGLQQIGVDSGMLVFSRVSHDPAVEVFTPDNRLPARLVRKIRRRQRGNFIAPHKPLGDRSLELFSTDLSQFGRSLLTQLPPADIINLHWVAGMFDFEALAELCRRAPVVWTLHDMNPLTGGCHFDEGCGRSQQACGRCPQLESPDPADLSAQILNRKVTTTSAIPADRLAIVGPSIWLTEQARLSAPFRRFACHTIPYGLETDVFHPRSPRVVRELADIPPSARVILFLAEVLSNRRKGFDLLVEALRDLGDLSNTYLLAVGAGLRAEELNLPLPIRVIPSVNDDRFLSFIYSAADVFVMASRADNLPNTVLESLCCGTPVAGFAVGGVPDLVTSGETGQLARPGDAKSLAAAVRLVLDTDQFSRDAMRERCRESALARHQLSQQAIDYQQLYRRMLGRPSDDARGIERTQAVTV